MRTVEAAEKAHRSAFLRGEMLNNHHGQVDISFNCENPVGMEHYNPPLVSTVTGRRTPPRWIEVRGECRRCQTCLRRRAWRWTCWAENELCSWPRSYLCTLTLTPDAHALAAFEVERQCREDNVSIGDLSEEEVFLRKCECIGQDVTRYLKRCREQGLRFRYMLVAERHKSGLPHFHMLVHEVERYTNDAWDTAQLLRREWHLGFSDVSGIGDDHRTATYVCKYLSKSMLARVRASLGYGRRVRVSASSPDTSDVLSRARARAMNTPACQKGADPQDDLTTPPQAPP